MGFRILDATSFYAGVPFFSQEESFTTPLILDEIRHIKKNHDAIQALIDLGRLKIIEPEKRFTDLVLDKARKTGDLKVLSKEDISILALSLQLKGELVTDDFAISNVAKQFNLKVTPIMTKGINRVLSYEYFCPICKKSFEKTNSCQICGSRLVRRSYVKKN